MQSQHKAVKLSGEPFQERTSDDGTPSGTGTSTTNSTDQTWAKQEKDRFGLNKMIDCLHRLVRLS